MSDKCFPTGGLLDPKSGSSQQQHDRESGCRRWMDIRTSLNDRSTPLHRALPADLQEACCLQLTPPQTFSVITASQHWYIPLFEQGPTGLDSRSVHACVWRQRGTGRALAGTYRRPREGHMVTVLLPRLVEALGKLLEESMRLVEDGKSQDVDTVVHKAVHSLERELLQDP